MLFILDDNKPYWPDTAIMKRRDLRTTSFNKRRLLPIQGEIASYFSFLHITNTLRSSANVVANI